MTQSRNILIIVRDFPPYYHSMGGIVRVLKLAQFLTNHGINVYVLAAKGKAIDYFGYEDLIKKFKVTYVDDPWQAFYNDQYLKYRDKRNTLYGSHNPFVNFFRNIIQEVCIPDMGRFLVHKYVTQAKYFIQQHNIKNVFVSSPPHSTQVIGLELKKYFKDKIKLFTDYRDSWNTTAASQKRLLVNRWLSERLESRILALTDYLIYCSPPMLTKINQKFFSVSEKSLFMMNGYDQNMILSPLQRTRNKVLTIGFFGRMYTDSHTRWSINPAPFFMALMKFAKPIKLVIYGPVSIDPYWRNALKDILEIKAPVNHNQVIPLMRQCDVLLVVYSEKEGADEFMSGKIFDYMVAERPILVVSPKGVEAGKLVQKENIGYVADIHDTKNVIDVLNQIYTLWEKDELLSYSIKSLEQYSRQYQYSKLLPLLD